MVDRDAVIPDLRYIVYYSNRLITPQKIAAFYTQQIAEEFLHQVDLPAGHYVIKDAGSPSNKDVLIKAIP